MITLLKTFFIDNWLRKLISLALAIIIWFVVDQSLTTNKTLTSVGIRIINLPKGKTINGLQTSGLLNKRIALNFTGKKAFIEEITENDLEVVVDASHLDNEGVVSIEKKHLVSLSPELSISHHINKLSPKNVHLNLVPLSEEVVSVYVTKPIGDAPKGYQYLDIWPYHLSLKVSGPADTITKLKQQGLKLTYNLNDITREDLEQNGVDKNKSVLSYFVPDSWKTVSLPILSDLPIHINDPDATLLRIDFIRSKSIQIDVPLPVAIVFSANQDITSSKPSLTIGTSPLTTTYRGVKVLNKHLHTKGVSDLFFEIVKNSLYVAITPGTKGSGDETTWSLNCLHPRSLEDLYVMRMITELKDEELRGLTPRHREEHLRNRFRNYMHRMQLYDENDTLFDFDLSIVGHEVILREKINTPIQEASSS